MSLGDANRHGLSEADTYALCGPHRLIVRPTSMEQAELLSSVSNTGSSFAAIFPKTNAMFLNKKGFLCIKHGQVRLGYGHCTDLHDSREHASGGVVLLPGTYNSLHQVFLAAESTWRS